MSDVAKKRFRRGIIERDLISKVMVVERPRYSLRDEGQVGMLRC